MDLAWDAHTFREWLQRDGAGPGGPWGPIADLRAEGRAEFWLAASSLPALHALAAEAGLAEKLRAALPSVHLFTVDALSAAEAMAAGDDGLEARLAYACFKRLVPEGIMLTRDAAALARCADARAPEDALSAPRPARAAIPMLDLRREYRRQAHRLDRVLLGAAAEARYILGPEVAGFETAFARYLGVSQVVGVSSGTDALVLALRALAMERLGRERFDASHRIITTPFTFVATGDAILRAGATPLFVDIDPLTFNLDASALRRCLEAGGSGAVGVIPVHLFGRPCAMGEILSLAAGHGLFVLEDVAQAAGAVWEGRPAGSLGDAAAFSFFPSKNLGGFGDAGAVATPRRELADRVRGLLRHGGAAKNDFATLGYNARLDTLQAAILLPKLEGMDDANRLRGDAAARYRRGLRAIPGLTLPESAEETGSHVYHQFTIRTPGRDGLQRHLSGEGIASMVYYPQPLHDMPLFRGRCVVAGGQGTGLPHAERAAREVLSLPIGPLMEDAEVDAVADSVRRFFAG